MIGRVVSTKMNKSVTVLIERIAKHPLYKKTFIRSKKYLVDDPIGVKEGDMVDMVKVRPVSKNKHWRIVKVVGKNLAEITEEKLKASAEEAIAEVMPEVSEPVDQQVSVSEEKVAEAPTNKNTDKTKKATPKKKKEVK